MLVPRIRDIRRSSLPQARQEPRSSVPPIATLPQFFPGVEDNLDDDEATDEETDQLDPSSVALGMLPDSGEDSGSDVPQEDNTIIGDELAGQRTEGEKIKAVEDEESGADSNDEIDVLLGDNKGYESESDLKAERNLRNAELDMATPPPPAPVLRRSGRNKK